jgi:hypothetical protein
MKRCIMSVLAVLLPSIATWGQTPPLIVFDGTTVSSTQQTLHIKGVPVQVHDYVIALYPMNPVLPSPVPVMDFAVQEEPMIYPNTQEGGPTGPGLQQVIHTNTWYCDRWFHRVATLEETANARGTSYPYLEINLVAVTQRIVTDEGVQIYPFGSISCWEARGWFGPSSVLQ